MGGLMHCITTHFHDASLYLCIFASEDFPALIYSLKLDTYNLFSVFSPTSPRFPALSPTFNMYM